MAARPRLNLIVTCAERKVNEPEPNLMLGRLAEAKPRTRARRWIRRLQAGVCARVLARDLYKGNHWHVVRSIIDGASSKIDVRVWVASAGYGLISVDASIRPYAATFSPRSSDSVGGSLECREWWETLASWRGPGKGPRSLRTLAKRDRKIPMLIVASGTYVNAMANDIAAAGKILTAKRLAVISAGVHSIGALEPYVVPVDSRLQKLVKGQMQSLNVRIAHRVLTGRIRSWRDLSRLRANLAARMNEFQPAHRKQRRKALDSRIVAFIRKERSKNSKVGHSVLLRRFRRAGFACEQERFHSLFQRAARMRQRS